MRPKTGVVAQGTTSENDGPNNHSIEDYNEWINTRGGDYDERDYEGDDDSSSTTSAMAFKGRGKGKGKGKGKKRGKKGRRGFARKPPCKYWPLGQCKEGKNCSFFHSEKSRAKTRAASATVEEQGKTDGS